MACKLIVKNLPAKFSENDKKEFLELFGSKQVVCLKEKMQNSCYVEFENRKTAKQALEVLHQFDVLGNRLCVEYAKESHENEANSIEAQNTLNRNVFLTNQKKKDDENQPIKQKEILSTGIAPNLGLHHDFPGHLHYKYPEPDITILTNIANAMATVPRFYTLVLHLMNKMNLPPPFGGPTPSPPLPGDSVTLTDACVDTSDLFVSSDESELESDSDNKKHEIYGSNLTTATLAEPVPKRKRLRTVAQLNQQKLALKKPKNQDLPVESAFELGSSVKRLEFKLGSSIKDAVEKKTQPQINYNVFDERGTFGKIEPLTKTDTAIQEEEEEGSKENINEQADQSIELSSDEDSDNYISARQLNENKIPNEDILAMNQFKKYKEGDRTNRLYIKNIGKQVVEQDLFYIFKRFVRHYPEDDKNKIEIRLMQEGRMKGQAFVTFPNEQIAEKALKSVHGYVLQDKPMVIQYGRAGK